MKAFVRKIPIRTGVSKAKVRKGHLEISYYFRGVKNEIEELQEVIAPVRERLVAHTLYRQVQSIEELQIFMEHNCFAVWDFMSLLKAL